MNEIFKEYLIILVVAYILLTIFIFTIDSSLILVTKTIHVNERLESCEAQGGRYGLEWDNYLGKYRGNCQVYHRIIEEF